MNIQTMSVNVEDKSISINGEGYICAPEYFPPVDFNIISMQWRPERQGRCKGSISRRVGGGEGLNDFTLFEPFVAAWDEAKFRKITRDANAHAEAQGAFENQHLPVVDVEKYVDDPLPRMFRSSVSPDVAPEMLERAADFEQRAIAVVDAARQSIEDSRSDRAMIDDLKAEVARVSERLEDLIGEVLNAAQRDGGGR